MNHATAMALAAGIVLLAPITGAGAQDSDRRERNAINLFAGQMTENEWREVVTLEDVKFRDTYLAGLSLSRELGSVLGGLVIELEGQVVRHFGNENLWEFNAAAVARWRRFPWSATLPTSIAFGIGPSYTSETPPEEVAIEGESQRLLVYWLGELELGLPDSRWSAFARLHHRSGVFGLVAEEGGANWVALGIRRRF
jgi:hypothetical protein